MSFSEEEIRRAADLKLWIESRITELQAELEKLRETVAVVDSVLKRTAFKRADEMAEPAPARAPAAEPAVVTAEKVEPAEFETQRPLRRSKDGSIFGEATITASRLDIRVTPGTDLTVSTPPFRSFFVDRILEGMRTKDLEAVSQGKLKPAEVLSYEIGEEDGRLREIAITNYREKTRLNEILNTATWAFSRMLEKGARRQSS